jgi:entericidin B
MLMIKKILSPIIAATLLATSLGTLVAGCNTVEGAGKDVEAGGRDLKNEARETKDKM